MSFKVLITDGLAQEGLAILKAHPEFSVDVRKNTSASELATLIADADCVVIRSATTLTQELIAAGKQLKLIVRAGAGVDNIDVPAATAKSLPVMNTASANSLAAAEQTIGLLFAMMRWIPQSAQSLKSGKWERDAFKGREVTGKTLGIVGMGHIGRIVAEKALGLGMRVVAYDPVLRDVSSLPEFKNKAEVMSVVGSLDEVLAHCDVLTVHIPKSAKTAGLIGAPELAKMKRGSYLLQCSRGGIVHEASVLEALNSGLLAGAAFDVFEKEPPVFPNALIDHPLVTAVPHLGASTYEAQDRVALTAAQQIVGFFLRQERSGIIN